jgi:hypothetical protein
MGVHQLRLKRTVGARRRRVCGPCRLSAKSARFCRRPLESQAHTGGRRSSSSRIPGNSDRRIADASRDVAQRIKAPAAIRALFCATHDRTGKPALFPAIFPDLFAPIVRNSGDGRERELVTALGHAGAASIWRSAGHQHASGPHWLAPVALAKEPLRHIGDIILRICRHEPTEHADMVRARRRSFGLLDALRGIRGPKSAPTVDEHELFRFLTTDANAVVARGHPKVMPVGLPD